MPSGIPQRFQLVHQLRTGGGTRLEPTEDKMTRNPASLFSPQPTGKASAPPLADVSSEKFHTHKKLSAFDCSVDKRRFNIQRPRLA